MSIPRSARAVVRARSVAAILCVAAGVTSSSALASRPAPVTLGEVASRVDAGTSGLPEATELLRTNVETEIASIDWRKAGVVRRYTVSAALVRLDSVRASSSVTVSCTVSATLLDADKGTLVAIVEGRARADDRPQAAQGAKRDALAVAARSAVGALPEAIRRLE